jgi:hypothetical protein
MRGARQRVVVVVGVVVTDFVAGLVVAAADAESAGSHLKLLTES